ncbi:ABC transporter ATP-binding protein [Chelatococcus sp. SYSU_G07232]|uniref:ABC transporter ATP-binding protein n=1 Tax=Chelatococcus albus TaxID=3047466 RepID=A0ABT7AIC8_9HYPH|nr:ABC transporter ATP-binding protein [Chelatococcus sp. SYSU_G07232]MDJ1159137.1 ABC transporter ATP-binding protein [Chelatococcus sp. SYSU_G07232]
MIELTRVTKRYGDKAVVDDLSLTVARGAFFVLVGPSGSGKSTTLKMINRLVGIDAGAIAVDGRNVRDMPAEALRRGMGYVIQSIGLFPHWTVADNIATVPRLLRWPEARVRARVAELIALLQLDAAEVARKYPHELSGGQQQRIGVARALAADPGIVLMDEPFGALDPITRDALQGEIARIHAATEKTIVFVTHDMDEALRLGTEIAILDQGRLVQCGSPADILRSPANDFVRTFVGGADFGLRLLGVTRVRDRLRPNGALAGPPVSPDASLKEALSLMIASRRDALPVRDGAGRSLGAVHLADLARA